MHSSINTIDIVSCGISRKMPPIQLFWKQDNKTLGNFWGNYNHIFLREPTINDIRYAFSRDHMVRSYLLCFGSLERKSQFQLSNHLIKAVNWDFRHNTVSHAGTHIQYTRVCARFTWSKFFQPLKNATSGRHCKRECVYINLHLHVLSYL